MESIYSIPFTGYLLLMFSGFIIAVSKTAVPGLAMLAIPFSAMVLPARASTGVVLVMLISADIFAVSYYRRNVVWCHMAKLVPCAIAGIFIGYSMLGRVDDRQLSIFIGGVIMVMLGLNYWWKVLGRGDNVNIPERWWFAIFLGLLAGITTMMANAAGPIMVIYFLAMGLKKKEFIGTGAFYFFIVNWIKVPFSLNLGLINRYSLELNLIILPAIVLGSAAGIFFLKKIDQKIFNIVVYVLTGLAALKLIL